jgi:hypothetical protein
VRRRSTASSFRQALEAWLIPEDGARPFVFRSGEVAHTTNDLVALCDRHWMEARQYLADGDLDRWFRERNRHDLVARARSARLEPNADAALEAFLRRLDPRLPAPRAAVEPQDLDFGQIAYHSGDTARNTVASRSLMLSNKGRGYVQATFTASVPWLRLEPVQAGCVSGDETAITVAVDASALPLRREHQAVVTCTPIRGARISVPVVVQLSLLKESLRRISSAGRHLLPSVTRGAQRGMSLWMRTYRSLVRSTVGVWVVVGQVVLLAGVMAALWWTWKDQSPGLMEVLLSVLEALPLAFLAVFLLPGLALIGAAIAVEIVRMLTARAKGIKQNQGSGAVR